MVDCMRYVFVQITRLGCLLIVLLGVLVGCEGPVGPERINPFDPERENGIPVPSMPGTPILESSGPASITLRWADNSSFEDRFVVERADTEELDFWRRGQIVFTPRGELPPDVNMFTDEAGIIRPGPQIFRVLAEHESERSDASDSIAVQFPFAVLNVGGEVYTPLAMHPSGSFMVAQPGSNFQQLAPLVVIYLEEPLRVEPLDMLNFVDVVEFNEEGTLMVLSELLRNSEGRVHLYDVLPGQLPVERWVVETPFRSDKFAFGEVAGLLASEEFNGDDMAVWELADGLLVATGEPEAQAMDIALEADRTLTTVEYDDDRDDVVVFRRYAFQNNLFETSSTITLDRIQPNRFARAKFTQDGRIAGLNEDDGETLCLYQVETGARLRCISTGEEPVLLIQEFNPDASEVLLVVSNDQNLTYARRLDISTGAIVAQVAVGQTGLGYTGVYSSSFRYLVGRTSSYVPTGQAAVIYDLEEEWEVVDIPEPPVP